MERKIVIPEKEYHELIDFKNQIEKDMVPYYDRYDNYYGFEEPNKVLDRLIEFRQHKKYIIWKEINKWGNMSLFVFVKKKWKWRWRRQVSFILTFRWDSLIYENKMRKKRLKS